MGSAPGGASGRENGGDAGDDPLLRALARAALLCSDATVTEKDGAWQVEGDLTDGALVAFAMKAGFAPGKDRQAARRIEAIPYQAARQHMAALRDHQEASGPGIANTDP